MIIKSYDGEIGDRNLNIILECLKDGGVIIYPTDTIYAVGCDLYNTKAVDRVRKIQRLPEDSDKFSLICADLSHLSDFCSQIDNRVFKLMKKVLPGPYTFILKANAQVPKIFKSRKKTVGIRVPDHAVPRTLVEALGNPIISSSIHDEDDVIEYITDPELIYEKYAYEVDIVIDGGFGRNLPSTVLDCSQDSIDVIRQGIGEINSYL